LRKFTDNEENNLKIFAEKLEKNLVSELDKKSMLNKNNKMFQRIRVFRKKDYDSVDLCEVSHDTAKEGHVIKYFNE
jgi:cupin superfamily acireductone dioxygenase involved in methionine salvage